MDESSSTFQTKSVASGRTQWHRILGTLFELLLTRLGIIVQSEVQVMSEPPRVDIVLLRRQSGQWTEEQLHLLCDGLRNTLASHLLIEFKYVESFSEEALLQALGYSYFYCVAQGLAENDVQTFVMVAQTPRRQILQRFGYETSELPGVYHSRQPLASKVQLIVLNQLPLLPHNAFVQCFASQRRIYQSAFERIQQFGVEQLSESLWELVAGLRTQRATKGGGMSKKVETETITAETLMKIGKETRKFILATLSREDQKMILAQMRLEDRLAGLAPEDRLAGLGPEERLAGLAPEEVEQLVEKVLVEKRLAGLAAEEMEQLVEKVPAEKRVIGLAPEERLAGLAPEEMEQIAEKVPPEKRLVGLTKEEMQKLLAKIETFLQQQSADK